MHNEAGLVQLSIAISFFRTSIEFEVRCLAHCVKLGQCYRWQIRCHGPQWVPWVSNFDPCPAALHNLSMVCLMLRGGWWQEEPVWITDRRGFGFENSRTSMEPAPQFPMIEGFQGQKCKANPSLFGHQAVGDFWLVICREIRRTLCSDKPIYIHILYNFISVIFDNAKPG